ncbi:D-aminoacyl-tRNA deacylase, partial [Myxococcota bacterium]|nr:D-aminoacyl-tRNA deacylase [Myxococcota bacterium]
MKAVLQRVKWARVRVKDEIVGEIEQGLMILLGVAEGDDEAKARALVSKIANMRIFADSDDKMNLSLLDINGGALVVSQ